MVKTRHCWVPRWGLEYIDLTDNMPYDNDLFIGYVGINKTLTTAIFDSGGARSMVDVDTATKLGIDWVPAKNGEFGSCQGIGGEPLAYTGQARNPVWVQLDKEVVLFVPAMKVIQHPHPILIIGGDTLRAGRP